MLAISSAKQNTALVVTLEGRIDASSAKQLEQQCLEWIDGGERLLVFDFSAVNYISSAGLRVFLLAAKRIGSVQGSVRLCALNATLLNVFEISGFSKLFAIFSTVQEAV
jgi:anti-anti-sigma factor